MDKILSILNSLSKLHQIVALVGASAALTTAVVVIKRKRDSNKARQLEAQLMNDINEAELHFNFELMRRKLDDLTALNPRSFFALHKRIAVIDRLSKSSEEARIKHAQLLLQMEHCATSKEEKFLSKCFRYILEGNHEKLDKAMAIAIEQFKQDVQVQLALCSYFESTRQFEKCTIFFVIIIF